MRASQGSILTFWDRDDARRYSVVDGKQNIVDEEPMRLIRVETDMRKWYHSEACFDVINFVNNVSTAVQGVRISDEVYMSETMSKLMGVFVELNKWVDDSPPIEQLLPKCNKAYRTFSQKLNNRVFITLQKALPNEKCQHFTELGFYLAESFGNSVRIDYGTGHELSFIFFLIALFNSGIIQEQDFVAVALRLFYSYLLLVRRLQVRYNMEPAGSQGVWGLNDFQFVPFIWGSAQLSLKTPFQPIKFLDNETIEQYKDEYMFMGCIDYIRQIKNDNFSEHSHQLWSITSLDSWTQMNSALCEMFQEEVLGQYSIMQMVFFGKLLTLMPVRQDAKIRKARLGWDINEPPELPDQTPSEKNLSDMEVEFATRLNILDSDVYEYGIYDEGTEFSNIEDYSDERVLVEEKYSAGKALEAKKSRLAINSSTRQSKVSTRSRFVAEPNEKDAPGEVLLKAGSVHFSSDKFEKRHDEDKS